MPAANPLDVPDEGYVARDGQVTPRRKVGEYLDAIKQAERHWGAWQETSGNIERQFANLERLRMSNRDRELQVFWANVEVLRPSVYARPPVPVVVPRFKDLRELPRQASETLERCLVTVIEQAKLDRVMRQVRDDLLVPARGQGWVRYVASGADEASFVERIAIDHVDRTDYLEEPARYQWEVSWRARRAYLTRAAARVRFGDDADLKMPFAKQDGQSDEPKAAVWELWDSIERVVVWVCEGCDYFLDAQEPPLNLDDFFPCPLPATGTLEPRTTTPVSDYHLVKDQLEEVNTLTGRIHALSDALKLMGFVPGGAPEVTEALNAAFAAANNEQRAILVPVSNFAAFGGAALKDTIAWLPMGEIAATVESLINLRRQVIDDVYQITGISDIQRGASDPDETATAQNIKAQWGSVRIRERQMELVRFARDVVRICAEIIAEQFDIETIALMSQTDLPRQADIEAQKMQLQQQAQAMMASPQAQQAMMAAQQGDPQAQQMVQQAEQQLQQQMQELGEVVTLEKVFAFLRDQKLRPFVLDIETDSTIQPDEDAEKQRRIEYLGAMTPYLQQGLAAVQAMPLTAPVIVEGLKFATGAFRAGRQMEAVLEELSQKLIALSEQAGDQPPGPPADPEKEAKAQAVTQKAEIDGQMAQIKAQTEQQRGQIEAAMAQGKLQADQMAAQLKAAADSQKLQLEQAMAQQTLAIERVLAQSQLRLDQAKIEDMAARQEERQKAAASKAREAMP